MHRYERQLVTVGLLFILTVLPVVTFAENLPPGEENPPRVLSLQDAITRIKGSPSLKAAAQYVGSVFTTEFTYPVPAAGSPELNHVASEPALATLPT